ncbi:MAG: hypothetical protein LQ350_007375 [Teloschistes chrysophthalmus]|nr:MAG: hypothetical protein LQ350_007375 [Niorma chrysophthalma]
MAAPTTSLFAQAQVASNIDPIPSSSAFGTPVHPVRPKPTSNATTPSVLSISLPPATLRPLAFRIFTKKHNLTLTSSALQAIADFIGTHCGSGWREEGLAEKVLDEIARAWKKGGGSVIVSSEHGDLGGALRNIEGCMTGGRIEHQRTLSRQSSVVVDRGQPTAAPIKPRNLSRGDSQSSLGLTATELKDDGDDPRTRDPRSWLRIVDAFEQPRFIYNATQRHFESAGRSASLLPAPTRRTALLRDRYQLVHQRLLRNEAFQTSTVALSRSNVLQASSSEIGLSQQAYKLTPIANLLGRSGSTHVLLGLLGNSPTGDLILSDLTGSIALDLEHARPVPEDGAWFTPGMIVLAEGLYEEEGSSSGPSLARDGGVGGTIGGRFYVASLGGPPCERREVTLGVSDTGKGNDAIAAGGFGWVDFLGVGSERATGSSMRSLEKKVLGKQDSLTAPSGRTRVIIVGEVNLDSANTLDALKQTLGVYANEPAEQTPMTFILVGNFTRYAVLSGSGSGGSIEYKEYIDSLASSLSEYPTILEASTFVFVPGDNDPWASAFSAGAAAALPKRAVPEMFTSRVKRAFNSANSEAEKPASRNLKGEVIWSTNPSRLTLFGPAQELVIFRDDMSGRLRRKGLRFRPVDDPDVVGANSPSRSDEMMAEHRDERNGSRMNVEQTVEDAESVLPGPSPKASAHPSIPLDVHAARKLVKTILDQGYLSPFPLTDRPVLWDYGTALNLYPLPTAFILVDPDVPPFALTYEGCHAMNPGALVAPGKRRVAQWMEYDARTRKGKAREIRF